MNNKPKIKSLLYTVDLCNTPCFKSNVICFYWFFFFLFTLCLYMNLFASFSSSNPLILLLSPLLLQSRGHSSISVSCGKEVAGRDKEKGQEVERPQLTSRTLRCKGDGSISLPLCELMLDCWNLSIIRLQTNIPV